jgi:hypothetical protein
METIYKPTEGAVEGAPVSVPMEKPDVPRNLTQAKESQAAKNAARRKRIEEVTISGDDKGIRGITKPNETTLPDTPSYEKYAAEDGTLDERTAGRARAREANIKFGHEINDEIFQRKNFDDDQAQAHAEYVSSIGRKASQAKTDRFALVKDTGESLVPLDDGSGEQSSVRRHLKEHGEKELTLEDATRYMANARQAGELAKEQLLTQIRENVAAEEAQTEQARPAPGQPTQPSQTRPPVLQPQQPDPLAQERARLQAEYNRAAALREHAQYTSAERQLEEGVQRLDQWAQGQPELQDHNLFQNLIARAQRGDVASANKLKQFQKAFDAKKAYVQKFVEVNTARVNRQIALEQHQAHQNAQVAEAQRAQHNAHFDAWLEKEHPHFAKGAANRELKQAAREILRERGMSDAQISQLRPTALEQSVLAESAMMRISRQRVKEVQKRGLPTVEQYHAMKPGGVTVGPRGGGGGDRVASLQKQLSQAKSVRQQTIIAGQLMKAKREAGVS